jgi:hypothetical protein
MGCVVQQVLTFDDVDDLGEQQVLRWVPQPGVEDPVRLEGGGVSEGLLRWHTPKGPPHPQTHLLLSLRKVRN